MKILLTLIFFCPKNLGGSGNLKQTFFCLLLISKYFIFIIFKATGRKKSNLWFVRVNLKLSSNSQSVSALHQDSNPGFTHVQNVGVLTITP